MSELTPEEIEAQDAAWGALDARQRQDPQFAAYLDQRRQLMGHRWPPRTQLPRRSGAMDDQHAEDLIIAVTQLLTNQTRGITRMLAILETIGVTLGRIEGEINALRTSDR